MVPAHEAICSLLFRVVSHPCIQQCTSSIQYDRAQRSIEVKKKHFQDLLLDLEKDLNL